MEVGMICLLSLYKDRFRVWMPLDLQRVGDNGDQLINNDDRLHELI